MDSIFEQPRTTPKQTEKHQNFKALVVPDASLILQNQPKTKPIQPIQPHQQSYNAWKLRNVPQLESEDSFVPTQVTDKENRFQNIDYQYYNLKKDSNSSILKKQVRFERPAQPTTTVVVKSPNFSALLKNPADNNKRENQSEGKPNQSDTNKTPVVFKRYMAPLHNRKINKKSEENDLINKSIPPHIENKTKPYDNYILHNKQLDLSLYDGTNKNYDPKSSDTDRLQMTKVRQILNEINDARNSQNIELNNNKHLLGKPGNDSFMNYKPQQFTNQNFEGELLSRKILRQCVQNDSTNQKDYQRMPADFRNIPRNMQNVGDFQDVRNGFRNVQDDFQNAQNVSRPDSVRNAQDDLKNIQNDAKIAQVGVRNAENGVRSVENGVRYEQQEISNIQDEVTSVENGVKYDQNGIRNIQDGVRSVQNDIGYEQNKIRDVQNGVRNVQNGVRSVQNSSSNMYDVKNMQGYRNVQDEFQNVVQSSQNRSGEQIGFENLRNASVNENGFQNGVQNRNAFESTQNGSDNQNSYPNVQNVYQNQQIFRNEQKRGHKSQSGNQSPQIFRNPTNVSQNVHSDCQTPKMIKNTPTDFHTMNTGCPSPQNISNNSQNQQDAQKSLKNCHDLQNQTPLNSPEGYNGNVEISRGESCCCSCKSNKENPTVTELLSIVKIQNEQLHILQNQVEKLIKMNETKNRKETLERLLEAENQLIKRKDEIDKGKIVKYGVSKRMMNTEPKTKRGVIQPKIKTGYDRLNGKRKDIAVYTDKQIRSKDEVCRRITKERYATKQVKNDKISVGIMTSFQVSLSSPYQHETNDSTSSTDEHEKNPPKTHNNPVKVFTDTWHQKNVINTNNKDNLINKNQFVNNVIDEDSDENLSDETDKDNSLEIGLNGSVEVEEPPLSPNNTVHVDIQDYESDSDDEASSGDQGWTFYDNILGKVNNILENSPVPEKKSTECTLDQIKMRALENIRELGNDVNPSDVSFHVKQLLMKYMPDEDLPNFAERNHRRDRKVHRKISTINNKILDITSLKKQPKLL